jgi:dTDP-4-amino-4,6-dideoxygalactose transaminase
LITYEQMYAKRDEIVEYYRNDLQKDSPLIRPAIKVSESEKSVVKETIQDKRFKRFEEICAEIAQQKKLPDQKHQTIYDSFVPPMTKKNFYNLFAQFTAEDKQLFAFNYGDFFRDKRVKVEFCKSARNRK